MKPLLILLLILISLNSAIAAEMSFMTPIPINLDIPNTMIQNGPIPYLPRKSTNEHLLIYFRGLQKEIIGERRVPETNLMEELEMKLIEIRTLQVCA